MTVTAPPGCLHCGESLTSSDARFCEACGTAVPSVASPNEAAADRCDDCGGEIGEDGYCDTCGMARPEPVELDDRGGLAAATHRGLRRSRNQDTAALTTTQEGWPVLVVADGVSRSPNPEVAARHASLAAADHLTDRPFTGQDDLAGAVAAAQLAASAAPSAGDPTWEDDGSHPACTLVVAVVSDNAVHTANVGDSRAYLLEAERGWAVTQLTADHSTGRALTSWLGADGPAETHFASQAAAPGDLVLACSDGLWNYATDGGALGRLVEQILDEDDRAGPVCEKLVSWALAQGGADNISVALAAVGIHAPHVTATEEEHQ